MVTALFRQTPARDAGYNMTQYVIGRVAANPSGAEVNALIGKLPMGAVITCIASRVVTAINGAVDVDPENLVAVLGTSVGSQLLVPDPGIAMPLLSDTEFYANISGGATTGLAYVVIWYFKL